MIQSNVTDHIADYKKGRRNIMCTALTWTGKNHYFGRNLDVSVSFHEVVCVMGRNHPLAFHKVETISSHYAFVGVATMMKETPLFYDATNEFGLSMAGLNFPGNATYYPYQKDALNLAPFELIPYFLGTCKNVQEARNVIKQLNVLDEAFAKEVPNSPLHWIISDKKESIVIETCKDGMHVYENPTGCMCNNPTFDMHLINLQNYQNLSPYQPEGQQNYCVGLGGVGLPGDASSMSRFVKVVFEKQNATSFQNEQEDVVQFFHILKSVEMVHGSVKTDQKENDYTVYSSCCNMDQGVYYFTTYQNPQIQAVDMFQENLDMDTFVTYQLFQKLDIPLLNQN